MGDSEMVATEAAAVMDYASTGYASTVPQSGDYATGTLAASTVAADGAYPASGGAPDGTAYANINSDAQGAHNSDNVTSVENASTAPSHGAAYNASVNGTVGSEAGSTASVENGNAVDTVVGTADEQQFVDGSVPTLSGEEERLWNIVRANSLEFDAWTALIEETEKVAGDKILKIRKVYDAFLVEFPLCYGYWKKYADHEARLGSMDKVVEVYERAVQGVTYSVDIWLHYCIFAIHTYGDSETIRRLFERGLAYVGTDYLCSPLWDEYIKYEEMHGEWGRVAMIYTRILEIPNRRLDDYLNRFKAFVASRPLSELRTADEAASAANVVREDAQPIDSGEHHPDGVEQSSKPVSAGLTEAEELEKYIAIREEIYKKAKEFDSKIADFENSIRRPYFHVRPLNDAELENWHNYLDFIERQDDFNKVVKLYERCLIACANYPEYWIRYVLCMEVCGSMDLANNALARATQVFVKRQPEIHLFAARFREQNGDIPGARAAYHVVHSEIAPGLLEAIINHANMENREGNLEDAFSLFEQAIAIEKGKEHSQTLPALYAQYTRFVFLVSKKADKAREILVEALENAQLSKPLLEAFIHLESFLPPPKRIDYLDSLVDKFIMPSPDAAHSSTAFEKEELSSIFLEFLGIFGDAQSIKKAADRHAKLFLPHRIKAELKKRHAEDYLASDKAKSAKAYTDATSPAQSIVGSYGSAQNQWAAGYGVQPQAWPQVSQAQWTPGYNQAAYGGYGAYGSSYATQAPASVAQTAAYGAYPPTYPSQQAFPQQNYAPPAAAAPLVPTQPAAASVPQPYYGTPYY